MMLTANGPAGQTGRLFQIQRFSLDDGPGIRSVVFLKGCNQACLWCHNPESLSAHPQLFRNFSLCTSCGRCAAVCPQDAIRRDGTAIRTDPGRCTVCGACIEACPVGALKRMGEDRTVEEVLSVLRRDLPYYRRSGGGVTVSGGEPTCQPEFLLSLLRACRAEGLRTAIETNGNTPPETVEALSGLLDYVMVDLKHTDAEKHRVFTGADNARSLEAIRYYTAHNETEVRIPLIPTFNDTAEELQHMVDFLADTAAGRVVVLPYHVFGIGKYRGLGLPYGFPCGEPVDAAQAEELIARINRRGLQITVRA